MAPPATDPCCCLRCGYALTGLELPRACPECGHPAEAGYEQRAGPACVWFNSWSAWGWCLRRSSRLPAGLFYVLHDAASRRTARRRVLLGLYAPIILSSLVALGGNSICLNYSVRTWYYNQNDPKRRVRREEHDQETDRLYAFNLHLFRGGLFWNKPASWVEVVERTRIGVSWATPDLTDPVLMMWLAAPWVLALCGYLPGRVLVWFLARRRTVRARFPAVPRAGPTTLSLMAIVLGVGLWLWVLMAILGGVNALCEWPSDRLMIGLIVLLAVAWTAGCMLGRVRIVLLDASRFIFPWPLRLGILQGGVGAVPVLWVALYSLW